MGQDMLIGINGKKYAGKNTVGDILARNHGFRTASFADPLKRSFAALLDVPVAFIETFKSDPGAIFGITVAEHQIVRAMTLREALQRYGTEAHRDVFGSDFWVDYAMANLPGDGEAVCFTDARFDNELSAIIAKGGVNIRVERPGLDDSDTHASEADPDPALIGYVIENDGTIEELEEKVAATLQHIIVAAHGFTEVQA